MTKVVIKTRRGATVQEVIVDAPSERVIQITEGDTIVWDENRDEVNRKAEELFQKLTDDERGDVRDVWRGVCSDEPCPVGEYKRLERLQELGVISNLEKFTADEEFGPELWKFDWEDVLKPLAHKIVHWQAGVSQLRELAHIREDFGNLKKNIRALQTEFANATSLNTGLLQSIDEFKRERNALRIQLEQSRAKVDGLEKLAIEMSAHIGPERISFPDSERALLDRLSALLQK